jgi:V8-like Glu-specific endopeptidase
MSYNIFLSGFAGGKCRIYQVYNSSSIAYITWNSSMGAYQIYFWGGSNGSSRYCSIENIGTY